MKKTYYIISFTAYYGATNEFKINNQKCPIVAYVDDISGIDFMGCVMNLIWNWYGIRGNTVEIHNIWKVPEHPEMDTRIPQT